MRFDVHVHHDHGPVDDLRLRLTRIERLLEGIVAMTQETKDLLDQIDARTNEMAQAEQADSAAIQNVSDDIDRLLAGSTSEAEIRARLQPHADTLAQVAANSRARSESLTALAAKVEDPIPPPVEPGPVQ